MAQEAASTSNNVVSFEETCDRLVVTGENLTLLRAFMALGDIPCLEKGINIALRGAVETLKQAQARGGIVQHIEQNTMRRAIVLPYDTHPFKDLLEGRRKG